MAKNVVNMATLAELIGEIVIEGAKEVEPGYQPRATSAKGVLENKGIVMLDLQVHWFFSHIGLFG